jgi:hypothetical protein
MTEDTVESNADEKMPHQVARLSVNSSRSWATIGSRFERRESVLSRDIVLARKVPLPGLEPGRTA